MSVTISMWMSEMWIFCSCVDCVIVTAAAALHYISDSGIKQREHLFKAVIRDDFLPCIKLSLLSDRYHWNRCPENHTCLYDSRHIWIWLRPACQSENLEAALCQPMERIVNCKKKKSVVKCNCSFTHIKFIIQVKHLWKIMMENYFILTQSIEPYSYGLF